MYAVTFVSGSFGTEREREHANEVLQIMLDALYKVNCSYLRRFPETASLYASGVRYRKEAPGKEEWQDIPTVLKQGFGDCEDLACFRAAELTVREGVPAVPSLKWQRIPSKNMVLYHILVERADGSIEDPSKQLGMGGEY